MAVAFAGAAGAGMASSADSVEELLLSEPELELPELELELPELDEPLLLEEELELEALPSAFLCFVTALTASIADFASLGLGARVSASAST